VLRKLARLHGRVALLPLRRVYQGVKDCVDGLVRAELWVPGAGKVVAACEGCGIPAWLPHSDTFQDGERHASVPNEEEEDIWGPT
jgi:hypothetical protein